MACKTGRFFLEYMKYLIKCAKEDKVDPQAIIYDVVKSSLGCYYPVPPQIQPH